MTVGQHRQRRLDFLEIPSLTLGAVHHLEAAARQPLLTSGRVEFLFNPRGHGRSHGAQPLGHNSGGVCHRRSS